MKTKNFFPIVFVLFLLAFMSCTAAQEKTVNKSTLMASATMVEPSDTGITQLKNSKVCMINNKSMSTDQIVVQVNNKTYYGCCEACVKALKEDPATRFAIDPLSNEQVDKATAFIIGKPGTKDNVLYFKSKANANEYIKKFAQQKL